VTRRLKKAAVALLAVAIELQMREMQRQPFGGRDSRQRGMHVDTNQSVQSRKTRSGESSIPYFVPPPRGTLPPLVIAWPPTCCSASITITEEPASRATVFEVTLESAVRICDASFGNIYSYDGNGFRLAAAHKKPAAFVDYRRRSSITIGAYATGRMATTKTVIHVADLLSNS
jgi:hypothetical protein